MTTRRSLLKYTSVATVCEPQITVEASPTVQERIIDAAQRWGLNAQQMLRIAWCESKFGTHANTYNGLSGHYGVFQFSPSTWAWASQRSGWYDASPNFDEANIETACWLMKNVGPSQWSCK